MGAPFLAARSISAADLARLDLAQRAAHDGEILGIDVDGAPFHRAKTGDHAIARVDLFRGRKVAALLGKGFQFLEGAGIQQQLQAFTRGELAFGVLFFDALLAAAFKRFGAAFAQFNNSGIFCHWFPHPSGDEINLSGNEKTQNSHSVHFIPKGWFAL